jgi:hypothetical protein
MVYFFFRKTYISTWLRLYFKQIISLRLKLASFISLLFLGGVEEHLIKLHLIYLINQF